MRDTETPSPRFTDIDRWPTEDAVDAMLEAQLAAAAAVRPQAGAIAAAAEAAAARLNDSGRLVYVGAGTSGRVAVQDGVELGPTFGWPHARLVFLMAGGMAALAASAEGAEDHATAARDAIAHHHIGASDVVIGVAASGRTPYTIAAIEAARGAGALTVAITNNPGSALAAAAELPLVVDTGSEVIAGSTRMKAGTAQKIVLNLLSTAIMLRLGRVHRGLMVDMVISNDKLLARAREMVRSLSGCDAATAATALDTGGRDIKTAVLVARGVTSASAADLLVRNQGDLGRAIAALEARAA